MNLVERARGDRYQLLLKQHRASLEATEALTSLMKLRDIKKSALAELLGKSRAWISKMLHGDQNLSLFTLVEAADALNADVRIEVVPRE